MDFPKNLPIPVNKIWAVYTYGSKVYGSFNEKSDTDYIVIAEVKEKLEFHSETEDIQVYPVRDFLKALDNHEIWALECVFIPKELKLEKTEFFKFSLDLNKLRESISQKSSHSWVKAKKKIEVEKDYLTGQKSLFHSLRILKFGIQIAKEGKIKNFAEANFYLKEIQEKPTHWETLKKDYQKIYNSLKSEFKLLTPKND